MAIVEYAGQPGDSDLAIVRGDTWQQTFIYESPAGTPVDLSGASARLQIRKTVHSTEALLTAASPDEITPGTDGSIVITVANTVTALLDFDKAVYDLEVTLVGDIVRTLLRGQVALIKDVTRD